MGITMQEALQIYNQALKAGLKNQRECAAKGLPTAPLVLDDIIKEADSAGQTELGIIEVPTDLIVGTKSAGRIFAFAPNFMPILGESSEFAGKWMNLCRIHMGDTGIQDPIRCFEYLGKFYVQEGNKRVSVFRHFGVPTIPGYVIRIIPKYSEDPVIQRYYDFLRDYQKTHLYSMVFTQPGGLSRLHAALGFEPDHVWTELERRFFTSRYFIFKESYLKHGGDDLPITPMDAMLVWLKVYSYQDLWDFSTAKLNKSLTSVWPDIKVLCQEQPIEVTTRDTSSGEPSLWGKLVSTVISNRLNVAFIHELSADSSSWTRAHMEGSKQMENALGDSVIVQEYAGVGRDEDAEAAMIDAINNGAQVIFTTTAPLIGVCRKIAAEYPNVKILNCSISMPYTGVRTYYSRVFEGKFISGAIAGAMCRNDTIGYIASYPIFGVPAGINAFALGAQMTNPYARIQLHWSCTNEDLSKELNESHVDVVSSLDIPNKDWHSGDYGAFQIQENGTRKLLASPYWDWGTFYIKLVRSILYGGWDSLNSSKDSEKAVNYWWGLDSGVIQLKLGDDLPEGVRTLAKILCNNVSNGAVSPFHRRIVSQDGTERNDGKRFLTAEEIINMNWLCDNVDGTIPQFKDLIPVAQPLVRLLGIYRDQLSPDKEGLIL